MNQPNTHMFAYGHLIMSSILLLYAIGDRWDPVMLLFAGIFALWSICIILHAHRYKHYRDWPPKSVYWLIAIDFLLLAVIFAIPEWPESYSPTWIVLWLVLLYAYEMNLYQSISACLSGILPISAYYHFQEGTLWNFGTLMYVLGIAMIIFMVARNSEQLFRASYYDALTQLPNRQLFMDTLSKCRANHRTTCRTAVLLLDLDGFKHVNDTMGHDVGDQVLQAATKRLMSILPKQATLFRMGGDEFAILLNGMKDAEEAAQLAQTITRRFQAPFEIDKHEIYLSASIGITLAPDDGRDANTLLRNADTAMYEVKNTGRNHYQFYTPIHSSERLKRVEMEAMLRRALERDELLVYYQPRLDVSSQELVCVEALVRWNHPEKGFILPGEFIQLAEENGLVVSIGEQVLRKACEQRKRWTEAGLPPFRVSVNLSAQQFMRTDLPNMIQSILAQTGLPPSMLELELTESAAMKDVGHARLMFQTFKEMGLTLAIDDFGTGYSSLSYLKKFPIDILKIDKSFTHGIHKNPDDAAIIRAIIAMGHSLKLKITAEGVETVEQLEFLRQLGCDEYQGYLIGKPMSAKAMEDWIAFRYGMVAQSNR